MVESQSSAPGEMPPGLSIQAVEWLPSGADSGLVRVRGRWASAEEAPSGDLPVLGLGAAGAEHRFESLPDARSSRDPGSWRGSYLVPVALVAAGHEALWLEWPGGARAELPPIARGAEPAVVAPVPLVEDETEEGGEVIDRAVLSERRARRAEAAEQAQSRVAAEALRAVEALELRSAELERRLAEAGTPPAAGEAAGLDALESRMAGERAVHAEVREELQQRLTAEQEARAAAEAAVTSAHEELAAAREAAEASAAEARASADAIASRVLELEGAAAAAEERLGAATAAATAAEARLNAESAARVALEDELDRSRAAHLELTAELASERDAHANLSAELTRERDARSGTAAELTREREGRSSLVAELEAAREAARSLTADLEAEREATRGLAAELEAERSARLALAAEFEAERGARRALGAELETLRADLDAGRSALTRIHADLGAERAAREADRAALGELRAQLDAPAPAEREGGALTERIAELDRRAAGLEAQVSLERAAREQAEAAAGAARRPEEESGRLIADLEAAAAALRETAPTEPPPPAPEAAEPVTVEAASAPPAAAPAPPEPEPAPERTGPKIVSPRTHPPREHAVGRSASQYPPLRGAVVKLAHDDPAAAGRLIAGLLPAHGAALAESLDYDLTIREVGTFSISVAGQRAFVNPLEEPRSRKQAEFHLSADALTLAELLAGVDRRIGRYFGAARYSGRRRRLKALRHLPETQLTFREAALAGARPDPGPVWKALSYAVHPSWTSEDRWTVAQEIVAETPETWFITSGNGDGLKVTDKPPAAEPETTVSMTRETFDLLLRGEPAPRGQRPTIRGNAHAAAQIKAWADRAQGLSGA